MDHGQLHSHVCSGGSVDGSCQYSTSEMDPCRAHCFSRTQGQVSVTPSPATKQRCDICRRGVLRTDQRSRGNRKPGQSHGVFRTQSGEGTVCRDHGSDGFVHEHCQSGHLWQQRPAWLVSMAATCWDVIDRSPRGMDWKADSEQDVCYSV